MTVAFLVFAYTVYIQGNILGESSKSWTESTNKVLIYKGTSYFVEEEQKEKYEFWEFLRMVTFFPSIVCVLIIQIISIVSTIKDNIEEP